VVLAHAVRMPAGSAVPSNVSIIARSALPRTQ